MTTAAPAAPPAAQTNGQAPADHGLTFVEPGAAPDTRNVLLYGPPGSGKSTGAATAPGPILWVNAEGPNALRFARELFPDKVINEVAFTGQKVLEDAYSYLLSGQASTVVLDTIGEMYRVLLEELSGGGNPTLQNYGDVNTKLERFVRTLRDLDVNVVILAHEEVADIEGIPTRRPVTGGKKLPEQLMAQMDEVGYTAVVPAKDDQPAMYMAQLVEANGRRAKNRGGKLGAARTVNLTEWIGLATGQIQEGGQ